MKKRHEISKQSYLTGLRCPKALHLKIHNPELLDKKDSSSSAAMASGLEFERTAIKLIAPKGVDVTKGLEHLNFESYVETTKRKLLQNNVILYQATFQTKTGERIMADVIRKKRNRIELIEIKAVTKLQDYHYYDVAFQYYCMENSGYPIYKVYLGHVNSNYIRNGELTQDLVVLKDVTAKIKQIQGKIKTRVSEFRKILNNKEQPDSGLGFHCTDPYPCLFKDYCWENTLPENNVFDIKGLWMKEKLNLYYAGIISMKQAQERKVRLLENQQLQVDCTLNNKEIFEREKIKDWLRQFKNHEGIYFLDFETSAIATPQYNGSKPWEAIPIQYSVHHKDLISKNLTHYEFLADPTAANDQRLELTKKLISTLNFAGDKSPIIVFSKFEAGRLKYLANVFPTLKKEIYKIIERLCDLADVFREKWHYHPDYKGSYSIKYVLPVLCPGLSYKNLEIRNGDQASAEYLKLKLNNSEKTRKALLEYCKLDTLATVRILEALQKKVETF